jgi:hypothetical protein
MKHPTACHHCRETKRKCTRQSHRVGGPCEPCQRRNLVCAGSRALLPTSSQLLLPKPKQIHDETNGSEASESLTLQSQQLPVHILTRLVNYYLDKLHNRPHSLFQPTKLRTQVQDGSVNKALLLAVCSMGSRFDDDEQIRLLENSLMEESKRLLLADLENICIENVQTCILIANLYAAHLNPSSEALFFRGYYPLSLDTRSPASSPTEGFMF